MLIKKINREDWVNALTPIKQDLFARTFLGKADSRQLWDNAYGCYIDNNLAGGLIYRLSKKEPSVITLELLHTFYSYRRKGVARILTDFCFKQGFNLEAKYFRVSSEKSSIKFYESVGFKSWGQQKSGTYLILGEIKTDKIEDMVYDIQDNWIYDKVYISRGHIF